MRFTALEYMLVAAVVVLAVGSVLAPTAAQLAAAFQHIAAVLPR